MREPEPEPDRDQRCRYQTEKTEAYRGGGVGGDEWVADRLFVFQLGNSGTVRKQLAEIKFRGS